MKPERLTREQSRDLTRERLLSAAHAIFLKKGCVVASVEDIAAVAGYTRGAFYSNFGSKTELLFELLKRDHDEVETELQRIFKAAGTREEMERTMLAYYRQIYRKRESLPLWTEAKLLAARDPRFGAHFNAFLCEKHEQMAACIRAFAERTGAPLPLPAEVLALGLMALCDGVQTYYAADPRRVTDERVDAVLAGFFAYTMLNRAPS
ncbi:TetR/AcrR family transcriptional regulator [Paraburkholderia sediminicola]|uniref:TetR/AcrR family transcriptional regulator n=1 Tax=Paraburkholderia sediminicola TaxID=458836 RepID=UPI0038B82702